MIVSALALLLAAAAPPPPPVAPEVPVEVRPAPTPAPPAAPPAATAPTPESPVARPTPPAVEVHGEVRTRGEVYRELDFAPDVRTVQEPGVLEPGVGFNAPLTSSPFADGERVLLRSRLSVAARPIEHVTAFIQAQDSRFWGEEPTTASNTRNLDVHQAWGEIREIAGAPLALKLGRQELAYGDHRLVGSFGWDNVGRAFDAAVLQVRPYEPFTLDLFWARLNATPWFEETAPAGDDFLGVYGSWKQPRYTLDLYVLGLYDRDFLPDPGDEEYQLYTPGIRIDARPVDGLHLNGEFAYQFGSRGEDVDVNAWALHAQAGYVFDVALAPMLVVGYDHATGNDDDPDEWETFDNLFPTNHDKYGLMDLAAWKNLSDPYVGVSVKPAGNLTVAGTVHFLSRVSEDDTFYRASGAPLVPLAAAQATDETAVGTELDFTATWVPARSLNVLLGYSVLLPGAFLDEVSPDDEAPTAHFAYLQAAVSF